MAELTILSSLFKKEDLVSQRGTITNKRKQHFTSFHHLDQIRTKMGCHQIRKGCKLQSLVFAKVDLRNIFLKAAVMVEQI